MPSRMTRTTAGATTTLVLLLAAASVPDQTSAFLFGSTPRARNAAVASSGVASKMSTPATAAPPTVALHAATASATSSPVDFLGGLFAGAAAGGKKEYTVVITGASGMIGQALTKALAASTVGGKPVKVVPVSRSSGATSWDPSSGAINAQALEGVDAVVHLAGENVGSGSSESIQGRLGAWTEGKKERILSSRKDGTALLVKTIQGLKNPPKVFLTASAVGYYGYDEGDRTFDESGPQGNGFLAEVTRVWEAEANKLAGKRGIRVVEARFGVVLSKQGGIIKKLLPIFNLGGGGIIGDGRQYLSWVSLRDAVKAIQFLLESPKLSGPVNVVAPEPATNAEFTSAMGKALFRPTVLPFPAVAAKGLFGEMGDEMLLGGQRAVPKKLLDAGFVFEDADILSGVKAALNE